MRQKLPFIAYAFVAITALCIGLFFRLYPLRRHTSGDLRQKATVLVLNQLRQQIRHRLLQTRPNLPPDEQERITQQSLSALLKKDHAQFQNAVEQVSRTLAESSNASSSGFYLLASDSFYYYQLTENILETGAISDTVKGSKYLNDLMLAPVGHWEPISGHPYVGAVLDRLIRPWRPTIPLMRSVGLVPLVITGLILVVFLRVCWRIHVHPLAAWSGALFFLLSPIFVKRSAFGWYDNDPYSLLFSLVILACLLDGLSAKGLRRCLAALGAGVGVLLYALFWQGWMLAFCVFLLSGILFGLYVRWYPPAKNLEVSNPLPLFGGIAAVAFLLISLVFGPQDFFTLFAEGWEALTNFLTPRLSAWPDIYISVSELHKASTKFVVTVLGGPLFLAGAFLGLLRCATALIKAKPYRYPPHLYLAWTLPLFFGSTFVLTLGAQRFALLLLIPTALLFTLGLDGLLRWSQSIPLGQGVKKTVFSVLGLLYVISPLWPARTLHKAMPALVNIIYNDTWDRALSYLRRHTPPDSIINTWWSPGHFIKATARRRVTFDGATINVPQAYWMANVFLSQTEEEAVGLLRMLNNSANQAADYLHKNLGLPLSLSVKILKGITPLPRSEAKKRLSKVFEDPVAIDTLLNLTHNRPPPSYCLIYNEFVQSNLQLKFIGHWNFQKIEDLNAHPERLKKLPKPGSKAYIDFLWMLAGGAYRYSGPLEETHRQGPIIQFQENIAVDLKQKKIVIQSRQYGHGVPRSLFYLKDGRIAEKTFGEADLSYSAILYQRGQRFHIILADRPLANSLLLKLYCFQGKGLRYFRPFYQTANTTRQTEIDIFRVHWPEP